MPAVRYLTSRDVLDRFTSTQPNCAEIADSCEPRAVSDLNLRIENVIECSRPRRDGRYLDGGCMEYPMRLGRECYEQTTSGDLSFLQAREIQYMPPASHFPPSPIRDIPTPLPTCAASCHTRKAFSFSYLPARIHDLDRQRCPILTAVSPQGVLSDD